MNEDEFRHRTDPMVEHGIAEAYKDVHNFHRVFDHPRNFTPTMQPHSRKEARADWIDEEVRELREASTLFDAADAYLDIAYFAIGGLVEMGINPGELWRIVHAANMAKVQPDGSVKRREDGKIIKPEGWVPPDDRLKTEIARQLEAITAPLFEHAGGHGDEDVQAIEPNFDNKTNFNGEAYLPGPDDGTADRLRTLHESGRAAVREAMGEPLKPAPAPGTRYKPDGFA
jgi:predicted HAD superfamily Cof-like phosphohydrolase